MNGLQESDSSSPGLPRGNVSNLTIHRVSGTALRADMLTHSQTRWSIPLPQIRVNPNLLSALARAFLNAEPDVADIVTKASETLGRRWRWIRPVARRFLERFG